MYYSGACGSAHTDALSGRARLRLCGLAVCCRILAEGDKLSGSHFTELVRILVDDGFFFFLSVRLMSV